ncbi:glycosyltransferase family 2 protein [Psychroserpens jangbogonensis]|uniref:glycosyltransferase family 2 protein n=1 Tax=Psychroserpens jangbogonensis TaxID=1484460 RepID=UPI00053E761D|nr:glycosyltransferase family 2 protein [Psychroserpens jangbogonensis]
MRVALVITVKNEARLLRQNLWYHRSIGIEKIYVYFDGTTDNGKQLINDIEGVESNNSVSVETFKHLDYMQHICSNVNKIHTARQCLNTYDAQMKCRDLGIDWLISLDADELFLTDHKSPISLSHFFEPLKPFDVVQLQTLEVLCRKMTYDKIMLEETQFKLKKNFKSHFNRIYFSFFNPYNKKSIVHSYWLGHNMGKLAIRVDSNTIPKNVHRYQTIDKTPLKSLKMGFLLHYHLYDFEDFIKKYKNFKAHPNKFLSGNGIGTLKTLWRDMVNDEQFNEMYLKDYFKAHILINKKKYKQLHYLRYFSFIKRKTSAIVNVTHPKQALEKVKQYL